MQLISFRLPEKAGSERTDCPNHQRIETFGTLKRSERNISRWRGSGHGWTPRVTDEAAPKVISSNDRVRVNRIKTRLTTPVPTSPWIEHRVGHHVHSVTGGMGFDCADCQRSLEAVVAIERKNHIGQSFRRNADIAFAENNPILAKIDCCHEIATREERGQARCGFYRQLRGPRQIHRD